jgi:hypothetical protein
MVFMALLYPCRAAKVKEGGLFPGNFKFGTTTDTRLFQNFSFERVTLDLTGKSGYIGVFAGAFNRVPLPVPDTGLLPNCF